MPLRKSTDWKKEESRVKRTKLTVIVFLAACVIGGCGGGGGVGTSAGNSSSASGANGPSNTGINTSLRVPAGNIVFTPNSGAARAYKMADSNVDDSTRILAQNVVLDTAGNALTSNNLQSAMDNELAIDLSKLLPGTTWTVTNKTTQSSFKGTTGNVTFSNNTIQLNSGIMAAAGISAGDENSSVCKEAIISPISYEILSNSVLFVTYTIHNLNGNTVGREAIITVVARDKNSLTLVGQGAGCGLNMPELSVLTKAASQKANFKTEKKSFNIRSLLASLERKIGF